MIALCLLAGSALLHWKRGLDAEVARRERQLQQLAALASRAPPRRPPPPALGPAAVRQLREQMVLLNRNWIHLSDLLAPHGQDVRLLGMDVNPATGAVRVTGRASTTLVANAYAESLGKRNGALQHVRLLGTERRPDGIRFEVAAQWAE